MLNEPSPGERKAHPLEQRPGGAMRPPGDPGAPSQRVTLHIPTVRPTVVYTLIAINVAIFLVRALSPDLDAALYEWGAIFPRVVLLDGEYHRLLSAMFLHAGIFARGNQYVLSNALHIVFNMYILYSVGRQLEPLFGHARFALIYLLGGLAGSVMTTVLSDSRISSVGASGAVFAIIGAEFVYLYQHRKLLGAGGQAQMRSLVVWALMNFAFGALSSVAGTRIRIDNWGHLGGLIGGVLLAWFIAPLFLPRRHPDNPGALIAEDANPLKRRYPVLSLYSAALIGVLIVATLIARS